MLPHLSPLNGGASAGAPVGVPPPPRFKPIVGNVINVEMNPHNPFSGQIGRSASQRVGLSYERKIRGLLRDNTRNSIYYDSPIYHFQDGSGWRTCIPDGLDCYSDKVVVLEIKSQHVPDAWWQLRKLYEPLTRRLFPGTSVSVLEICRTYDPQTPFPEAVTLVDDFASFLRESRDGELGVYRWRV